MKSPPLKAKLEVQAAQAMACLPHLRAIYGREIPPEAAAGAILARDRFRTATNAGASDRELILVKQGLTLQNARSYLQGRISFSEAYRRSAAHPHQ